MHLSKLLVVCFLQTFQGPVLWDTGLCPCAPQVLNALGRKTLIPERSRDLFTAVITFTFCSSGCFGPRYLPLEA